MESDNKIEPDINTIDGFSSTLKVSAEGFGFGYHVLFRSAGGGQVGSPSSVSTHKALRIFAQQIN